MTTHIYPLLLLKCEKENLNPF